MISNFLSRKFLRNETDSTKNKETQENRERLSPVQSNLSPIVPASPNPANPLPYTNIPDSRDSDNRQPPSHFLI